MKLWVCSRYILGILYWILVLYIARLEYALRPSCTSILGRLASLCIGSLNLLLSTGQYHSLLPLLYLPSIAYLQPSGPAPLSHLCLHRAPVLATLCKLPVCIVCAYSFCMVASPLHLITKSYWARNSCQRAWRRERSRCLWKFSRVRWSV